MFCILYFGSTLTFEQVKHITIKILLESGVLRTDTDDELIMSRDSFTFNFMKESSHSVRFASEDYKLDLQYSCSFEIRHSVNEWRIHVITFVTQLMDRIDGDVLFLNNGDSAVFARRSGQLFLTNNTSSKMKAYPLHLLGEQYVEVDLEQYWKAKKTEQQQLVDDDDKQKN